MRDHNAALFQQFSQTPEEQSRRYEQYVSWLEEVVSKLELSILKMQQELRSQEMGVAADQDYIAVNYPPGTFKQIPIDELTGFIARYKSMLYELQSLSKDPFHLDPMYEVAKRNRSEKIVNYSREDK